MKSEQVIRLIDALVFGITAWQKKQQQDSFFDGVLDKILEIKASLENGDLSNEQAELMIEDISLLVRGHRDDSLERL